MEKAKALTQQQDLKVLMRKIRDKSRKLPFTFIGRNFELVKDDIPIDYTIPVDEPQNTSENIENNKSTIARIRRLTNRNKTKFEPHWKAYEQIIFRERSFWYRNRLFFVRLILQSLAISFAFSFAFSLPLLLQLIPLNIRLDFPNLLLPLKFILDPLVGLYYSLKPIIDIFQSYNPLLLYLIPGAIFSFFNKMMTGLCPVGIECLGPPKESFSLPINANDPDIPTFSSIQSFIANRMDVFNDPYITTLLVFVLTLVPSFFFLCGTIKKNIIECIPEKKFRQKMKTIQISIAKNQQLFLKGVKYNRFLRPNSIVLRLLRFFGTYGPVLGVITPILIGFLLFSY